MNYIDIVEKQTTAEVKNNVVYIDNKLGIQGPKGDKGDTGNNGEKGEDGITPHIDTETNHWMIGDTDTGILAGIPDDVMRLSIYDTMNDFPEIGEKYRIYIDESTSIAYRFKDGNYVKF